MKLDPLSHKIKLTEDFDLLSVGEIKGWLSQILPSEECNLEIIEILEKSKKSLLVLNSKMPSYWHDSVGESHIWDLIYEIDAALANLKI